MCFLFDDFFWIKNFIFFSGEMYVGVVVVPHFIPY